MKELIDSILGYFGEEDDAELKISLDNETYVCVLSFEGYAAFSKIDSDLTACLQSIYSEILRNY